MGGHWHICDARFITPVHMVSSLSISIITLSLTIRPVSVMSSPHSSPGCPSKIAVHRQSECAHFTEAPWGTVCCYFILVWKSARHDVSSWHVRKQCSPKHIHRTRNMGR